MKAIRIHEFGPPEVMILEETEPLIPAAGEVLIDIRAIGVNPVDTYIRAGWYGQRTFPFTPGLDAAGVVRYVDPAAEGITPGMRVFISGSLSGTYAAQCLCRPEQVHWLPDSVDFEQGASLGVPYGTAYRALFQRARAVAGQTVLVHGASGGVGLAAIQLAKAAGLTVIATAGTEEGRQLLVEQGATLALDHHASNHLKTLLDFTDGKGVDILLEMLANVNLGQDLTVMAKKGRIAVIGSRGPVEINPREMMSREVDILGVMSGLATAAEKTQTYAAIEDGLANGALYPIVGTRMLLSDAATAHHAVIESPHHGKIVLTP